MLLYDRASIQPSAQDSTYGMLKQLVLFSAYASKLFQVIKNHLPNAHAYADDTQLHLSFKPDSSADQTEARSTMERCIRAVRAWLIVDKLKLNEV